MAAHRGHATRAGFALWLLVLVADVAAGGSAALIATLTAAVGVVVAAGTFLSLRTGRPARRVTGRTPRH